jgi:hypothetical protein
MGCRALPTLRATEAAIGSSGILLRRRDVCRLLAEAALAP